MIFTASQKKPQSPPGVKREHGSSGDEKDRPAGKKRELLISGPPGISGSDPPDPPG
jgi:hypothetical protein